MEKPIHPSEINFEDGVFLVKLARRAVEEKLLHNRVLKPPVETPKHLYRPGMTFTTIETVVSRNKYELRGCIGFLQPVYSLVESTIISAIEAALNDPRFPPMEPSELDNVVFEVSILSVPEEIVVDDRWKLPSMIVIGRDGLIAERGFYKGTLLPIVPLDYCWDAETFLSETCIKAGLKPDCWLDNKTRIYRYMGRVFREIEPHGVIIEVDMNRVYKEKCFKQFNQ